MLLFTTKFAGTTRVLRNAAVAEAVISSTAGLQTKLTVASRADVPLPNTDYTQNAVTSNVSEWEPPSSVTVWEPPMHVTNPINGGDDPAIFNTIVNDKVPTLVVAYHDNASNVTVMSTTRHMTDVRPVHVSATTASSSPAVATHTGKVRWGFQDKHGRKVAVTTNALCIPSQPDFLFGTNTKTDGVKFDTVDWDMTCSLHGVSVPVTFDGRYRFNIVLNPPWPDIPADAPLPTNATLTDKLSPRVLSPASLVFTDVPSAPELFTDMPHMTVSESSPTQCQSAEVPLVQGDILMSSMIWYWPCGSCT